MVKPDTHDVVKRNLAIAMLNHISAKAPRQTRDRRIRSLQRSAPSLPSGEAWILFSNDSGEFRVADPGATTRADEHLFVSPSNATTRGFEVDKFAADTVDKSLAA